jgi:uncharacterized protein (TIGR02099 family)
MLSSLAGSLAPAATALDEWLGGLQPRGELRNLRANFDPKQTADDRLQFAANLDALGISPHAGVPGLENVSGSISGNLGQGALRLDAEDFVLYLQGIFPEPWKYAKAGGLLSWTLNDQALSLHSPFIRLDGEEGRIAGDLKIAIPFADDEFSYMDLRVGMTQGNAAFIAKYLPLPSANFSEGLAQWLKTAIVAGQIDEGIFIHQGTLSASAPEDSSTLSLYFRLNQLELAYQPDWPALREAEGEVFVEDNGVRVLVSSAVILDSQVSNIAAQVPPALRNQSLRLKLSADLQSSVWDALTILRTAPLELEQLFSGWQGEGDLFGKLSLEIPLSGPTPPLVVVDFATSDAQLRLPSPALQLSQINGAFRYNSAGGLSSPKFRARAFNQPVSGRIVTEGARGTTRTHIEANSKIALADLTRWLGLEGQVLPVEGVLPYKLTLTLDDHSHLLVESTLQGLSIELPAPFGKTAGAVRNSRLRMNLDDKDPVYRVSYADLASLALAMPGGKLDKARGELMLGGQPATLPAESGLTLQGSVSELDVSAWQALARRHAANAVSLDLGLLRPMQLQVGQFSGFGLNAENLGVRLQRDGAAWQVGLASAEVDGQITLPDQAGLPLLLDFKRLSLPEPPATDAEAVARPDPLDAFDPSSLPALDVQIAEVLLGGERLGGSAFKARPIAGGVEFSELDINLKGLKLTGAAGWLGRVGTTSSWYKGRIQGTDIGAVLQAWNFAPTATSKRFRVDADVRWPGSPAHVSLTRLSGSLDGRMNDGSFTQVKGGGVDALRAFGLLNLSAIGQRLRMDFSDTVGKGMGYERLSVVLQATNGVFVTRQPLEVKGPSAQLQMEGTLDMSAQQIDARLNVTLPVFNTATVAALIVGAPVVAGSIFVADKVAEKLFGVGASNLTRVQYQVKGPMADPAITFFKQ